MNGTSPLLACAVALVVAVGSFARQTPCGRARFLLGLYAGALLAYVGADLVLQGRLPGFENASLLFVPLGVLLVAPWREALAALPLALGVARLGCLPEACCYASAWNALPELAGWIALHLATARWPRHTTPIVLCGFGAIRLLSLPLRGDVPEARLVEPAWMALAWIAAGILLRDRLDSATDAREWFTARTEPLLRTLVLVTGVWLLFPLLAELLGDTTRALVWGSLTACALVAGLRRPVFPRFSVASAVVLLGAVLLGSGAARLAHALLGHADFAAAGPPPGSGAPAQAFVLVVLAPVFEELLYRERLLGVLLELWGWLPALLLSSALFAVGHMQLAVMPVAFTGGLVCGVVMLRTGSLAAVIGLHAGWNLGVLGLP